MNKPLEKLNAKYPELYNWLKEISRYSLVDKFIQPDYKNGIHVFIYTHNYRYSIKAKLPSKEERTCKHCKSVNTRKLDTGDTAERIIGCLECGGNNESFWGYLGCTVTARKPRAGEDWVRGNDLADGAYCKETWRKIKDDIISYELVKIIKK